MSTKVFKQERRGSTFVDPLLSCCGFLCLSPYRASNINQQGSNERDQGKRIQRTAGILICRCEMDITINAHEEDEKD